MHTPTILYSDNHLLILNKPAGMPSQGDITGDECITDWVKNYLKETYNKPGNVFAGLIHRIDRPVSGALAVARTSKGLERMNNLFKNREVQKIYWAIVKNEPPAMEGTLHHFLKKHEPTNTSKAYDKPIEGSLECKLDYKVIAKSKTFFLLEINPHTGRHHQIRVQLSTMGCPIVGDMKYGFQRGNTDKSVCLHSRKLAFTHPISGEAISVIAPLPELDFWHHFDI